MRFLFCLVFTLSHLTSFAQHSITGPLTKDSIIVVKGNPKKGFLHDYILFLPKETPRDREIVLLVEPNNTGRPSDSIAVHKKHALDLASVSSVGNNVSTMLKIPLLVPIFPRPSSKELTYTHALDRDVMLEESPELKRLDLQLLAMIKDGKMVLDSMGIKVKPKVFMSGFSASATFTNRFSLIHPKAIKALAIGGFNGELMLPQESIHGIALDYPLGLHDFTKLFGHKFDIHAFRKIPQFIYMGALDQNDAVQYEDAYSSQERQIINSNLGDNVQERYLKCQELYRQKNVEPIFKTYGAVGHWTTSDMNFEVIKFFFGQMQEN